MRTEKETNKYLLILEADTIKQVDINKNLKQNILGIEKTTRNQTI